MKKLKNEKWYFLLQFILILTVIVVIKFFENESVDKFVFLERRTKLISNILILNEIVFVAIFSKLFEKPVLIKINFIFIALYFIYFVFSMFY